MTIFIREKNNTNISEISFEELTNLINFYSESNNERIYFSGYKITEHKDFSKIIDLLLNINKLAYIQFDSDLIFDVNIIKLLIKLNKNKNKVSICSYIDFNDIKDIQKKNLEKLNKSNIDIDISINLSYENINFDNFFKFVKTNSIKTIRWEIDFENNIGTVNSFYNRLRNNLLLLLKNAMNDKIKTYPKSCNIPLCYFSDDELRIIVFSSDYNLNGIICEKNIIVYPDMSFKPCKAYNGDKLYLKDYDSFKKLEEKCDEIMKKINSKPLYNNCDNCEKYITKKLSCGCIKFK